MVTSTIKELAAAREKLAQLERAVETELHHDLSGIHEQYGFSDVESFLNAVRSVNRGGSKGPKAGRPTKAAAVLKTRKRAVITDATRAQVKKLVGAGKSGSQIAKTVGISLPSVQNIKKALGLVKSRGVKTKPAPATKKLVKKKLAKKRAIKKVRAKKASATPGK